MTDLAVAEGVDRDAILRHLNLDPNNVNTHALLLICGKYGLDPLLKHMVLISGKPYVTRDGYMHIAHSTGQLDGIEVVEEGETPSEWWAKVAVWRKDMSKPFTYRGRYPKDGQQKKYGPEMAIKTAEVMAMRRAFDVTGVGAADEQWDEHVEPLALPAAPNPAAAPLVDRLAALPEDAQEKILNWFEVPADRWHTLADEHLDRLEGVLAKAEAMVVPASSTGQLAQEAGGESEVAPAAEAPDSSPATIDDAIRDRLLARMDALPDAVRRVVEDTCVTACDGRFPNDLIPGDVPVVSELIEDGAKSAKPGADLAARAMARAGKPSAA